MEELMQKEKNDDFMKQKLQKLTKILIFSILLRND